MLSSSQVQLIEESLKAGRKVYRLTDCIWKIEFPSHEAPVAMMTTGLEVSCDDLRASEILIGDLLSNLRPH